MAYRNPLHNGRLILLECYPDAFAEITINKEPKFCEKIPLIGGDGQQVIYLVPELGSKEGERDVYNYPVLFHGNGLPWYEANSYLISIVRNKSNGCRPTDYIRKQASKLLVFKIFCESSEIDWLDFSAKRPALRPTYKYFAALSNNSSRSAAVVNQYTHAVYSLYEHVSIIYPDFDLRRVDSVKQVKFLVEGAHGSTIITAEKRSQTRRVPATSMVPIGYLVDGGDVLRPLQNVELDEFRRIISQASWGGQERLIIQLALMTGARKQSILTMRMKHLKSFESDKLLNDGTFKLHAGPGTGIDTKYDVPQQLYVPEQLASELRVYAASPLATQRRKKFMCRYRELYPDSPEFDEEEIYLFLSNQGGEYYMGKSDPRYGRKKSRPTGQVTAGMQVKLFKDAAPIFPRDFSFHWLRATFAYLLYQALLPFLASGLLNPGEEISIIQKRMHHRRRETTENYLKLFNMTYEKLEAQEKYEKYLFGDNSLPSINE